MAVLGPTYTDFLAYSSDEATYWDNVVVADGTTKASCDPGALKGSLVQMTFSRSEAVGVREDLAIFGLHVSVATGTNNAWAQLNASDATAFETAFDTTWTNLKTKHSAHWNHTGYIWRHYGADFPKGKTGLSKPGPVWRQTTRAVPGTSPNNTLPDQTAETVTFRTSSRRHWGRIYLPAMNYSVLTAYSRLTTTDVDYTAQQFNTLLDTLSNLTRNQHVFIWNSLHPGQFSIRHLVVDDVPDVIRRRRPKMATYEKSYGP